VPYIVKNTLLQIAFSAVFLAYNTSIHRGMRSSFSVITRKKQSVGVYFLTIWHCIPSAELTKTHSFRLFGILTFLSIIFLYRHALLWKPSQSRVQQDLPCVF